MNERPTMRFNGNVSANTTIDAAMIAIGCASAHSSDAVYRSSSFLKNQLSFVLVSLAASESFRNLELSIGVSVKLTIIDTRMLKFIIQPNGLTNLLLYPVSYATRL